MQANYYRHILLIFSVLTLANACKTTKVEYNKRLPSANQQEINGHKKYQEPALPHSRYYEDLYEIYDPYMAPSPDHDYYYVLPKQYYYNDHQQRHEQKTLNGPRIKE